MIAGDFNIAHKDIDVERSVHNRNNIMFTEEERARVSDIIDSGYMDTFRLYNEEGGNYTWWPYAFDARKRNVGRRIDYVFVSRQLGPGVSAAFILDHVEGSDHCPIGIELDDSLLFS
jgi:exodeoxyribonuclease-3